MADAEFSILVEEKRRGDMAQLAKTLTEKGLRIDSVIERFRQIRGSGDPALEAELKAIDGIEVVRRSDKYQLPPVDEKIPQ
jgi:hypothetical protein